MLRLAVLCVVSILLAVATAQKTPAPTGSVTGRVLCGDTRLPARFTKVLLVRRPSREEIEKLSQPGRSPDWTDDKQPPPAPEAFDLIEERTGMDGSYRIPHVPPGDYWVLAKREGYILPIGFAADRKEALDLDRMMAANPVVHVQAGRTEEANVALERGATITGRVVFDDGLPAVGWDVWVAPEGAKSATPFPSPYGGITEAREGWRPGQTATDDEGRFRMAGLPPGKYVVVTELDIEAGHRLDPEGSESTASTQELKVFGPGVFSRKQASTIEIEAAEVVDSADLKIDLSHLHSIRGRVLTLAERKPVPNCRVTADGEDVLQQVKLGAEGAFSLDYLPPGTYKFTLIPAFPDPMDRTRHFERPKPWDVVVGDDDLTLDDILLIERKVEKKPNE